MDIVQIRELSVTGISIKTNNAVEMQPETGKIPALWSKFNSEYMPNLNSDANIYGVYYEYESDETGDFRLLAGSTSEARHCNTIIKEQVYIKPGDYLCFKMVGEMPQAVIQAWEHVWTYFDRENNPAYTRRFETDFEQYVSETEVHVYIGVESG